MISEKLKKSIMNRCCETPTGIMQVPDDLIKRYKKETGSDDPNWKIKFDIVELINRENNL